MFQSAMPAVTTSTVRSAREASSLVVELAILTLDVTDTMALKLEAIRCHASQVADFKDFESRMKNRAASLGQAKGYAYAEGFDRIVVPG
jgi:LmbE family N-acetylglucosaminyl deacetylase